MPLQATHIKFALDKKDQYRVQDLTKYISGAVYPDSRRFTGVGRHLTHNDNTLSPEFADTDFKKGWAVHFLCDRNFNRIMKKNLNELSIDANSTKVGSGYWFTRQAILGVLDIELFGHFDIQPYLPMLNYLENPCGESVESIKRFNKTIQGVYAGKKKIGLEDIRQLWFELEAGNKEVVDKVIEKSEEIMNDQEVIKKINSLYQKMLEFK
ncbi:MAG: hypothetical protein ABIH87_01400 [bacterium]